MKAFTTATFSSTTFTRSRTTRAVNWPNSCPTILRTEQGTWRLPASEEEEKAKREARVKGLGRRVKRYIAQFELGAVIPDHERPNDATLAEWIRHCKRAGLYEQGKLLYEKGGFNPDDLPEEAMVNVEEDYQVCVRMLARDEGKGKRKK